jgi:hypothetical protein
MKISKKDTEKVVYTVGGMAAGTFAMKAIEKAISGQAVSGLLGLEGVATLNEIAPPVVVAIIGTGFFAQNRGKTIGYAGLGAAASAGARAIDRFTKQNIFSGLGAVEDAPYVIEDTPDYPAIAGDGGYYYDDPEDLEGAPVDDDIEIV